MNRCDTGLLRHENKVTNPLLISVRELEAEITARCASLTFTSNFPGEEKKEFHLADVMDPVKARNNCSRVSERIVEALDFSSLMPGLTARFSGIQSPMGNHYAVLLSHSDLPEESSVILDFTAKQFDVESGFPLIMDCWQWQYWVEEKLGRQGNWYHSYAW